MLAETFCRMKCLMTRSNINLASLLAEADQATAVPKHVIQFNNSQRNFINISCGVNEWINSKSSLEKIDTLIGFSPLRNSRSFD